MLSALLTAAHRRRSRAAERDRIDTLDPPVAAEAMTRPTVVILREPPRGDTLGSEPETVLDPTEIAPSFVDILKGAVA